MKNGSIKSLLVLTGGIIFNLVFWKEKMGVNTILFDLFILASVFYLYPKAAGSSTSRWLAAGNLVSLTMIIIHNTVLSKFAFSITLLLFISFAQYLHRSIWYAAGSVLSNYFLAIPNFISGLKRKKTSDAKTTRAGKKIRMLIIPVIIVCVFVMIYSAANTVFSTMLSNISDYVSDWISNFFSWFSPDRFLFLGFGILITAGLILVSGYKNFSVADLNQKNSLSRRKNAFAVWKETALADMATLIVGKRATGILALKTESIMAFVSLVLLNSLLLAINVLDIEYVWFGFKFSNDINLAEYVHEGAGMLIFSIVLAMLLLLFFFRANLNFYRKNIWLKRGAYLWIIQNFILVISVFMRDYYYVVHYGLAYKRIGLLFFLAMVIVGLVTVALKIRNVKTNYYLLRINAWAGIILLVLSSTIHWDETIVSYNLARKNSIPLDVEFLVTLSDKTLPLLEENKDIFSNQNNSIVYHGEDGYVGNSFYYFENRKIEFLKKQEAYTWLSWNAADYYVKQKIKTGNKANTTSTQSSTLNIVTNKWLNIN